MAHCALCSTELKSTNTPIFGKLNDGNIICNSCFKKTSKIDPNFAFHLKDHSLEELQNLMQTKKKNNSPQGFPVAGCIILIVIAVILFFTVKSCFFGKEESNFEKLEKEIQQEKENRKIDAFSYAEICIKQNLKAPASAIFHMLETRVWELNDSTYRVKGPVDSQNEYGALLRYHFSCDVIIHDNETFDCENISFW